MKRVALINAMVAETAAVLASSPQYPGILRRDRKDQVAGDQIIAMPSVKAHNRRIRDSWSGKRKDRIGTYKGKELKDMGVTIGLHSIIGTKAPTLAVYTPLANMAMLTTITIAIITLAEGTITTSSLWKQPLAAPEQASPRIQYLRLP